MNYSLFSTFFYRLYTLPSLPHVDAFSMLYQLLKCLLARAQYPLVHKYDINEERDRILHQCVLFTITYFTIAYFRPSRRYYAPSKLLEAIDRIDMAMITKFGTEQNARLFAIRAHMLRYVKEQVIVKEHSNCSLCGHAEQADRCFAMAIKMCETHNRSWRLWAEHNEV